MSGYLVHPLGEPVAAYSSCPSPLGIGWLVDETSEEAAALAVHRVVRASTRRYAVLGGAGPVLIDLSPVDGCESLSLEPGPHR